MEIQNIIKMIRKWLLLIILLPILCVMVAGYYFYQLATPVYTSTAKILVFHQQDSDVISGSDLTTSSNIINDFCVIITSTPVLQDAADSMLINRSDGTVGTVTLAQLKQCRISVSKGSENRIVTLSVTSENASLAYNAVEAIVESATLHAIDYLKTENIRVIEPASEAARSGPASLRNTALAGLLGLAAAVGFAFLVEMLNTTIREPEDVEKLFGLPVLAKIPKYENREAAYGKHS
ncbi:MAG: Wzz/FepE/Etk N-terminal domain-containing protein [Clostridia bacterium]|nr:Wzz/FepE/Etk N-terminal domain-containing protein [Clostridia bacterium]